MAKTRPCISRSCPRANQVMNLVFANVIAHSRRWGNCQSRPQSVTFDALIRSTVGQRAGSSRESGQGRKFRCTALVSMPADGTRQLLSDTKLSNERDSGLWMSRNITGFKDWTQVWRQVFSVAHQTQSTSAGSTSYVYRGGFSRLFQDGSLHESHVPFNRTSIDILNEAFCSPFYLRTCDRGLRSS